MVQKFFDFFTLVLMRSIGGAHPRNCLIRFLTLNELNLIQSEGNTECGKAKNNTFSDLPAC